VKRILLLLLIATSAVAQEIPVSDPVFEPQTVAYVSVATISDRFVTVWGRSFDGGGGIYASVTDLNGTLVRGPVVISTTGSSPAIASAPNGSLVAWLDGNSLFTATIDVNGNASAPALLVSQPSLSGPLSVTWNGSRFLVLNQTLASGVIGYLFDQNGERISDALTIGNYWASTTADGSGFLLFAARFTDETHPEIGTTILGRRIDASGATSPWTEIATSPGFPQLSAIGRVLFWEYGGAVHRVVTDSNGAAISQTVIFSAPSQQLVKAVPAGSGILFLLWDTSQQRSSLLLVDSAGGVTAQQVLSQPIAGLAAIGTSALLVATGTNQALTGYIASTPALQVSGPRNIGRMAVNQLSPQIANNGSILLAVWGEPSTASLFAARIDPATGRHLDGRGILLDSHQGAAPAVAQLGSGFVVAYIEVSSGIAHLMIRRVFADGTLDSAPTLVSTGAHPLAPRLASDGNQALLVWTENTFKIRGTRIDSKGAILDPAFLRISDADALPIQLQPDAGVDGENYLVAWQSQKNERPTQIQTSGVRVTRSGVVLDPPTPMTRTRYGARVAGNAVAATDAGDAFLNFFGGGSLLLGTSLGVGDIEEFGDGQLVVGTRSTGFNRPTEIWAVTIIGARIVSRFNPVPNPASADQPSLTRSALTYIRATSDEGYGGSMRAYVVILNEQRRRPATPAR